MRGLNRSRFKKAKCMYRRTMAFAPPRAAAACMACMHRQLLPHVWQLSLTLSRSCFSPPLPRARQPAGDGGQVWLSFIDPTLEGSTLAKQDPGVPIVHEALQVGSHPKHPLRAAQ